MRYLFLFIFFPIGLWGQDLPDQEVEARGQTRTPNPTAVRPDIHRLLPAIPTLNPIAPTPRDSANPSLVRLDLSNRIDQRNEVFRQGLWNAYAGAGQYLSRKVGGSIEYPLFPDFTPFASIDYSGTQGFTPGSVAVQAKKNQLSATGGVRIVGKHLNTTFEMGASRLRKNQYQTLYTSAIQPHNLVNPQLTAQAGKVGLQLQSAPCNPLHFLQRMEILNFSAENRLSEGIVFNQKSNEKRMYWQPDFRLDFGDFQFFTQGNLSAGSLNSNVLKDRLFQVQSGVKLSRSSNFKVDIGFALSRFNTKDANGTTQYERNYYMPILGIEGMLDRNLSLYLKHEPITQIRDSKGILDLNPFTAYITEVRPRISSIHFKGGMIWGTAQTQVRLEGTYEKSDETLTFAAPSDNPNQLSPIFTQAQLYVFQSDVQFQLSKSFQSRFNLQLRQGKQSNLNPPNRALPFYSPIVFETDLYYTEPLTKTKFVGNFHAESSAPYSSNPNETLKPFLNFATEVRVPVMEKLAATLQFQQNRHRYEGITNLRRTPPTLLLGLWWQE